MSKCSFKVETIARRNTEIYGLVESCNRLLPQLTDDPERAASAAYVIEMLEQPNFHLLMVFDPEREEDRDRAIAMACIYFVRRPEGWTGEIHSVVVDENYRGQGIGRALSKQMIATARQHSNDCNAVFTLKLTSKPTRVAANRLYESLGFKIVGRADETEESGTNYFKLRIKPSSE